MNYDVKPKNLTRQERAIPLTIPQLIRKYKLDSLWKNIEKIVNEVIEQNSGYVVKKNGVMYIADNNNLEKAVVVLRIGENFLDISYNGIDGEYLTIISLDGTINADFIKAGTIDADLIKTGSMSADRINGGTLILGGEKDKNGLLEVLDEEGNELVQIGKNGIILKNGTKLIGNGGILSNLQFNCYGISRIHGDVKSAGQYKMLGFMYSNASGTDTYDIFIDVEIPDNFKIFSAYITLNHIPQVVHPNATGEIGSDAYGCARNVKCYISDLSGTAYVEGVDLSEYGSNFSGIEFKEISNCFDNSKNSFTPKIPTSSDLKVTTIITNDISNQLLKRSRIKIATTNSPPELRKTCYQYTGFIYAQLNVYGYLS